MGGLVVVGESLVDIVVDQGGEVTSCVGGSPLNVAVGLARLEVPTQLITQVGDDEYGHRIADHVRASGAWLAEASVVPGRTTSTSRARLGAGDASRYEFDLAWDLPEQDLPESLGLHVGSLGASLRPGRGSVLDLARQAAAIDLFLSYDPNIRPALAAERERVWLDTTETASLSTLVKVSDEDLHVLRPGESPAAVAHDLLAAGRTELVIVTRGFAGALAFNERFAVEEAAVQVDVVDTIGAGDSFMAAALAILCDWHVPETTPGGLGALGEDHIRVLLRGAMTAAGVTCSRRGANPPTRQELPSTWPTP